MNKRLLILLTSLVASVVAPVASNDKTNAIALTLSQLRCCNNKAFIDIFIICKSFERVDDDCWTHGREPIEKTHHSPVRHRADARIPNISLAKPRLPLVGPLASSRMALIQKWTPATAYGLISTSKSRTIGPASQAERPSSPVLLDKPSQVPETQDS